MSKRYYLNNTDSYSLVDEFFPLKGGMLNQSLDPNSLTQENLEAFISRLSELIQDVRIEEEPDELKQLEDLDFLEEPAKGKLKELFSDPNLYIFGHGGNAETVFDSGHFYCRYSNIQSHFLGLDWDQSLDSINHWPHRDSKQILFLALNKNEINPIYQNISTGNPYSAFEYEIPLEYFAGYYDRDTKDFVINPNFKKEHDYNPNLTDYEIEIPNTYLTPNEINDFYKIIRNIAWGIYKSSKGLSKKGYEGLCNQYIHFVEILRKQILIFNKDYFDKLYNQKIDTTIDLLNELDKEETYDFSVDSGWEDDWEPEEENPPKL